MERDRNAGRAGAQASLLHLNFVLLLRAPAVRDPE